MVYSPGYISIDTIIVSAFSVPVKLLNVTTLGSKLMPWIEV